MNQREHTRGFADTAKGLFCFEDGRNGNSILGSRRDCFLAGVGVISPVAWDAVAEVWRRRSAIAEKSKSVGASYCLETVELGENVRNEPGPQASDEYAAHWVVKRFHECQRGPFRHGVTGRLPKQQTKHPPKET
jgi:hypothetical protein